MQSLKTNGWHAVTLDQVQAYWSRGTSLGPGKPIVITFDNGYASHYTNALPVLKGLGWVGVENLQVTGLPPSEGGLTDTQIRGLITAGWELDTQGLDHTDLTALDPCRARQRPHCGPADAAEPLRRPRELVQLPLGRLQPDRHRRGPGRRLRRRDHRQPRVGKSASRTASGSPRLVVTAGTSPSELLAQIAAAPGNHVGSGRL